MGDGGPMPDAYMGVRIIEGPNTTNNDSLVKRGDVPVTDQSKLNWKQCVFAVQSSSVEMFLNKVATT
jgi:hypothetical protein